MKSNIAQDVSWLIATRVHGLSDAENAVLRFLVLFLYGRYSNASKGASFSAAILLVDVVP